MGKTQVDLLSEPIEKGEVHGLEQLPIFCSWDQRDFFSETFKHVSKFQSSCI